MGKNPNPSFLSMSKSTGAKFSSSEHRPKIDSKCIAVVPGGKGKGSIDSVRSLLTSVAWI